MFLFSLRYNLSNSCLNGFFLPFNCASEMVFLRQYSSNHLPTVEGDTPLISAISDSDNFGDWFNIVIKIKGKRFIRHREDFEDIDKITYKELNESLVKYFKNRPFRYKVYSNKQYSHFIFDKDTRNKVQLTLEPKDNTIIIYPFTN